MDYQTLSELRYRAKRGQEKLAAWKRRFGMRYYGDV